MMEYLTQQKGKKKPSNAQLNELNIKNNQVDEINYFFNENF